MRIAALVASYNRAETTVRGLELLADEFRTVPDVSLDIYLVDDGSSDGTSERVASALPSVIISHGDGSLFWNGGMCAAFQSSKLGGPYDAYLLFNDDVELIPGRVEKFVASYLKHNANGDEILVGATASENGDITYSGFNTTSRFRALPFTPVVLAGESVACDSFNGNFVLIPGTFFESIGGLDARFSHGLGDIDLGLVARKNGITSRVESLPIGICEKGPSIHDRLATAGFRRRWSLMFQHPHGLGPYLHFVWKHRPRVLFPAYFLQTVVKRGVSLVR